MDASGIVLVLFAVGCGMVAGYLLGRQHNADELNTLRGIVRENQHRNLEQMTQERKPRHDQTD